MKKLGMWILTCVLVLGMTLPAHAAAGTVQGAVDALTGPDSDIALAADTAENITIGADKTVRLNLNGFTLTGTITVNGSLTILDASDGQTGMVKSEASPSVGENGSLTLESGKYSFDPTSSRAEGTSVVHMTDGYQVGTVSVSLPDVTIKIGESKDLLPVVTVNDVQLQNSELMLFWVKHESGTAAVTNLTQNGVVSGVSAGKSEIVCCTNGTAPSSMSATCTVTVVPETSGSCGDSVSWSFADGRLSFSGTGAMTDYASHIDTPWVPLENSITSISISNGITHIGSRTMTFNRATSVEIPASVTSVGEVVFGGDWIRTIKFLGHAPALADNAFDSWDNSHSGVKIVDLTVQYPANDSTWDSVKGKNYSGVFDSDGVERVRVTWVAYGGSGGNSGNTGGGNSSHESDSDSSSGNSGSTTTETSKNPDGSTTTTVTDKKTGTVTETTKTKDGSTLTVETKKDGTATTTETAKNGVKVMTVDKPDTQVTISVTIPQTVYKAIITIPVNATSGMVAVDAKTGKVITLSVPTKDGMAVKLETSANLILVDNAKNFTDTTAHWAEKSIDFVTARELFSGTSADTFEPNRTMNRAMLMTVLARFDGEDTTGDAYAKGMAWAQAHGVSDGSNPTGDITREQLVTMLWRYAGSPAAAEIIDDSNTSEYATGAFSWAVEAGLVNGMSDGSLNPQGNATRAQLAVILERFVNTLVK